jgi:signal transduction histidine kinase
VARALEVACVIAIVLLLCDGFEGTLLVFVALQLGRDESRRFSISWIVVQTALLYASIAMHWSPRPALLLTPPYLGFQLLAYLVIDATRREAEAREEVSRLLAESSRVAERLRLAHELHDTAGHHLGALSLHLEAALQRTDGPARDAITTARSLATNLLADIRRMVAERAFESDVALDVELHKLAAAVPRPHIHLDIPEGLRLGNPERARVVIRCAQEIITNAAKHSGARNLWLSVIAGDNGSLRIDARDDGSGAASLVEGVGLRGMRLRVEKCGGELRIATAPGTGFGVMAIVP